MSIVNWVQRAFQKFGKPWFGVVYEIGVQLYRLFIAQPERESERLLSNVIPE